MNTLNKEFHRLAENAGCCDEYLSYIETADKNELMNLYVKGIDFSIKNPHWLSNDFIKDNFTEEELALHKIYVDADFDVRDSSGIYVARGCSNGKMFFCGFNVATVYALEMSKLDIYVSGNAHVFVKAHHMAEVHVVQSDLSKCYVYFIGDLASVTTEGDVIVRK